MRIETMKQNDNERFKKSVELELLKLQSSLNDWKLKYLSKISKNSFRFESIETELDEASTCIQYWKNIVREFGSKPSWYPPKSDISQKKLDKLMEGSRKMIENGKRVLGYLLVHENKMGRYLFPYKNGCFHNGRRYSAHALERMSPDTPEMNNIISARIAAKAERKDLVTGTEEWRIFFQENKPDLRGILPEEIEEAIANGAYIYSHDENQTAARMNAEFMTSRNDLIAVINENDEVITAYRNRRKSSVRIIDKVGERRRFATSFFCDKESIEYFGSDVRVKRFVKKTVLKEYKALKTIQRKILFEQKNARLVGSSNQSTSFSSGLFSAGMKRKGTAVFREFWFSDASKDLSVQSIISGARAIRKMRLKQLKTLHLITSKPFPKTKKLRINSPLRTAQAKLTRLAKVEMTLSQESMSQAEKTKHETKIRARKKHPMSSQVARISEQPPKCAKKKKEKRQKEKGKAKK